MFSDQERLRYNRHIRLKEIGEKGQIKLKNAKVLVVGAGGLGCPVLQYLTAAGVGNIGIIDGDTIDLSNLQRQVLYTINDVGKQKSTTAISVLAAQNPEVIFNDYPFFLDKNIAIEIIKRYDIIIDCTDNFSARYLINDACVILGKPFVYGALHKFSGQVSVFNFRDGATYRCLYPNPPKEGDIPTCAEVGVIGILPSLIGTLQAIEVIKIILEIGVVLSGKLLTYNVLDNKQQVISFTKSDAQIKELGIYDFSCELSISNEIGVAQLKLWIATKKQFNLIDIREEYERDGYRLNETHHIPMGDFMRNMEAINFEIPTVVFCQYGAKSKAIVGMLKKQKIKNVMSLIGGVQQWVLNENSI